MAANAGEIRARLVLSNSEFKKKMGEAREDMKTTGMSAEQLSKDFGAIQKASLVVGGAVAAGIGASVKIAADFEQGMANVRAISGSTAEEFAKQEEAARKMGAETVFSATEASEGLSYLAMAGFDVSEQVGSLPAVLNGAIAGNMELGQSAEIVTNIMSAFKLGAEDSGMAVDVLAKAANSANTDIPLMGEAFKMVAPIAESLGFSIEETAAAIGELGNVGISGSQAGTVLRTSLLALANPTGQTKDAIEDLNIELLDSDDNMKPLPELMGHIADKMEGMSDAQKTQAASQLVGTQAAAGFIALLEVGEDGLQDFTTELENSEGAAQEMADVQRDTLAGSFKEFQSAMEEAGIKLGNEFLPLFRDIVEWGTEIVGSFDEIDVSQAKSAIAFAGTAAAIGLTISTIGKLVIAVRGLMASMGPAGWLIAGISVLGGLFAANAINSEDLGESVARLSEEFDELQSLDEKIDEFDRLQLSSQLTNDEFARYVDLQTKLEKATDPKVIEALQKEMAELEKKSGLSNGELDSMVGLNDELVEAVPEATEKITDQGNAIIDSTTALKEYSRAKLESLYQEMDLERLATEVEYKEALEEESEIIEKKKGDFEKLNQLKDERREKQNELNDLQSQLNEMEENSAEYSFAETKSMEAIVQDTERELELAEKRVAEQAKQVQGHDDELEKTREKIENYETILDQMVQVLLQQEGLTSEKGKGLQVIRDEIFELKQKRKSLELNTDESLKNTEEYRNSLGEIDSQISRLRDVRERVQEITAEGRNMNESLGASVSKNVRVSWSGTTIPPHLKDARPIQYHTGGIIENEGNPLLKMHDGGNLVSKIKDMPLHNEVDVRLLQNEMVLTEGQQSNLWRMIQSGAQEKSSSSNNFSSEFRELIGSINDLASRPASFQINEREFIMATAGRMREEIKNMDAEDEIFQD